ncbi:hypothetical protein [Streptomyces sp. NPDC002884]|uniref:hypothetical protein n=1 Tax=Streptomyces sp. NPDC002884 TaxID=3154544 RepID=UPI00331E277C
MLDVERASLGAVDVDDLPPVSRLALACHALELTLDQDVVQVRGQVGEDVDAFV